MRPYFNILLDGVSILEKIRSLRIERRRDRAVDTFTVELADFSLYSSFDFGLVPVSERIQVGTEFGTSKIDGSTSGIGVLTSLSSNFTSEGVTINDIIEIIKSNVAADIGGFPITAVGTTTLTSSHIFGTASGIEFIVLKNQGKFFVEKPDVLEDRDQIAIPSLWGRNSLARLTDPFAAKLTKTFKNKTSFSVVVKDLVKDAGMDDTKVQIDIADFVIPGNLLSVSNRLPLSIIIDLATKTNGYVRSDKNGDLHVKKDLFHFGALPIAQTLGDDEVLEMTEQVDFPEFGNRILVRSVLPESGQDVRVTLSLETSCIRGDGRAQVEAQAVVTDLKGNPVPDGTSIDWTRDDPTLFSLASQTLTGEKVIKEEGKRASSLTTVSTDLPIVEVLGVFIKQDSQRKTDFFIGGSFVGRSITLGVKLPFSNSEVFIDYVAGGVSANFVQSVAGSKEGSFTFINAIVGQVRDSKSLCIRNSRNIFLTLIADPSSHNLCLPGAHQSTVIARVRDNGGEGQLIGIQWSLTGPGSLSESFSLVKDELISSESGISRNLFTVNTRFEIVSVVGVFLSDDGKSGTNFFTTAMQRTASFSSREIILGTNLPGQRERVIIEYKAKSIAIITYIGPTIGTGPDLSVVTAKIDDGTELGIKEKETILLTFRCPDPITGEIPGVDSATGLPTGIQGPKEPKCRFDCDFSFFGLNELTECICKAISGSDCPTIEAGCREMCQDDFNKNGKSSLTCQSETSKEFCGRETGQFSGSAFDTCKDDHEAASVDKCVERCLNHSGGGGAPLSITGGGNVCDGPIKYTAVGGSGPYTWEASGGEGTPELALSGEGDSVVTVTPPDSSPVSGIAFRIGLSVTNSGSCPNGAFDCANSVGCDGVEISGCTGPVAVPGSNFAVVCTTGGGCPDFPADCIPCSTACSGFPSGNPVDTRTQQMKDDGCLPCAISMDGVVITVTDAFGNEAVVVVETE